VDIVAGFVVTLVALAGLAGGLYVIYRGMANGIRAGVGAVLKGRTGQSLPARVGAVVTGVLSLTCGLLVLPALYWYAERWDHLRTPSDLPGNGYRLPPLDPMDAVRVSLLVAAAGLVLGVLATVFSPSGTGSRIGGYGATASVVCAGFALLMGPFAGPHKSAEKAICLSNMKNIALAIQMYAADNADMLPSADAWCYQVGGYTKNRGVFLCERSWGTPSAYAYNDALNRASLAHLSEPASLIAVFESNAGWNAHGGPELLVKEPRHLGGDNWGFADGHVSWVSRSDMAKGTGTKYRWSR
jgi:prepilin-type processing-associated H-X9-DG protein